MEVTPQFQLKDLGALLTPKRGEATFATTMTHALGFKYTKNAFAAVFHGVFGVFKAQGLGTCPMTANVDVALFGGTLNLTQSICC